MVNTEGLKPSEETLVGSSPAAPTPEDILNKFTDYPPARWFGGCPYGQPLEIMGIVCEKEFNHIGSHEAQGRIFTNPILLPIEYRGDVLGPAHKYLDREEFDYARTKER